MIAPTTDSTVSVPVSGTSAAPSSGRYHALTWELAVPSAAKLPTAAFALSMMMMEAPLVTSTVPSHCSAGASNEKLTDGPSVGPHRAAQNAIFSGATSGSGEVVN